MVVLIDYHTPEAASDIAPEDWLALIVINEPEHRQRVHPGWKRVLALEFAEAGDHRHGFMAHHAESIAAFWDQLVNDAAPLALAIRCDATRRRSAALARALAGTGTLYLASPGSSYSREIYEMLSVYLDDRSRLSRRAAVLERIRRHLSPAS
jgi:hypothetical protein